MNITEVRIKLMEDSDDRLQAFCSITFDDSFVVRDLKIIEGSSGPFVAMPSRKLTSHCNNCGSKNHLRAGYCNGCGQPVKEDHSHRDADGRSKLYADIAHPINSQCREMIQNRVITEFEAELQRSSQPGYVSRYDDEYVPEDGPRSPAATPDSDVITTIQPPQAGPSPPHINRSTTPDNAPRKRGRRPNAAPKTHSEPPTSSETPTNSPPESASGSGADSTDAADDFGAGIF